MNHADLLRKYIGHVIACESVSFIPDDVNDIVRSSQPFTAEELEELHRLEGPHIRRRASEILDRYILP